MCVYTYIHAYIYTYTETCIYICIYYVCLVLSYGSRNTDSVFRVGAHLYTGVYIYISIDIYRFGFTYRKVSIFMHVWFVSFTGHVYIYIGVYAN